MTIYDISKKAGVSIATVSRVLNGSDRVSEKTRQKVLDVIRRYEYTPNAFARGLGLNTMKTIGILCADSSDPYLAKAIYYLEKQLRANGYDSILSCCGYEPEGRVSSLNLLLSKKVDAVIMTGSNFVSDNEIENKYIQDGAAQVPVMLLNASFPAANVYSILSDDYTSMYNATMQMIQRGVTDPVYFYRSVSYSSKKKLAGFQAAMAQAGLHLTEAQLLFYPANPEDIPDMAKRLHQLSRNGLSFHGVIAADDTLAIAAVKYGREAGLSIPDELAVIGYNNSMLVHCCEPALTSVDNKLETMCEHLITTLLGVLGGQEMPRKTVFSGELIRRGTL